MREHLERSVLTLLVLAAAALLVWPAAHGHGAAVGIHLHLKPDPATPGEPVEVSIRADLEMTRVEAAFTGYEKHTFDLEKPSRAHEITLRVPETVTTEVITIHLRAETTSGEERLTSAILKIADKPTETPKAPGSSGPGHSSTLND